MKTLVSLLMRLLDFCLFVLGIGFCLPLLTGTTWIEGIFVLSISVVVVYLGGYHGLFKGPTQVKVRI